MRVLSKGSILSSILLAAAPAYADCRTDPESCVDIPIYDEALCYVFNGSQPGGDWRLTVDKLDSADPLFVETGPTGASFAFGGSEMQSLPAGVDTDILVTLDSNSDRTEAMVVHGIDPEVLKHLLYEYAMVSNPLGQPVMYQQGIPLLPQATAIPHLTFGGGTVVAFDEGNVTAARVYDRGECSFVKDLDPIYDELNTAIFDFAVEFFDTMEHVDGFKLHWSTFATYLGHPVGSPSKLTGGFVWDQSWTATVNIFPNIDTWTYGYYRFGLSDGILAITPDPWHYTVTGYDQKLEEIAAAVEEVYGTIIPEEFLSRTRAEQTVVIDAMPCDPMASPAEQQAFCADHIGSSVVEDAIRRRGEVVCLSEDEITQAISSFEGNWSCPITSADVSDPLHPVFHGACAQTLRAKRINVYPDQIELVWFDDVSPDNPVYALWLALNDPTLPDILALFDIPAPSVSDLCTPRDESVHLRPFAWDHDAGKSASF